MCAILKRLHGKYIIHHFLLLKESWNMMQVCFLCFSLRCPKGVLLEVFKEVLRLLLLSPLHDPPCLPAEHPYIVLHIRSCCENYKYCCLIL